MFPQTLFYTVEICTLTRMNKGEGRCLHQNNGGGESIKVCHRPMSEAPARPEMDFSHVILKLRTWFGKGKVASKQWRVNRFRCATMKPCLLGQIGLTYSHIIVGFQEQKRDLGPRKMAASKQSIKVCHHAKLTRAPVTDLNFAFIAILT